MDFKFKELEVLLDPNTPDHQASKKLEIAKRYFQACANCINTEKFFIEDRDGFLLKFEECFFATVQIAEQFNTEICNRIKETEEKLNLSQNAVKLGLLSNRKLRSSSFFNTLFNEIRISSFSLSLPEQNETRITSQLLLDITTALIRLSNMSGAVSKQAEQWWVKNEDVLIINDLYDPRKINKTHLKKLVEEYKQSIVSISSTLPGASSEVLENELQDVIDELNKKKTSWNKVLSKISQTILIIAALTTISANVDKAYENGVKVFNYISSRSIEILKSNENKPLLPSDLKNSSE